MEQFHGGVPRDEEAARSAPSSLASWRVKFGPPSLDQPFQLHLFRYSGPPAPSRPSRLPGFCVRLLAKESLAAAQSFAIGWCSEVSTELVAGRTRPPRAYARSGDPSEHAQCPPASRVPSRVPRLDRGRSHCPGGGRGLALTVLVRKHGLRAIAFVLLAAGYISPSYWPIIGRTPSFSRSPPVLAFGVAGPRFPLFYDFTHEDF